MLGHGEEVIGPERGQGPARGEEHAAASRPNEVGIARDVDDAAQGVRVSSQRGHHGFTGAFPGRVEHEQIRPTDARGNEVGE